VPTLGWVRTVRFSALLKVQSLERLSTLSSSSIERGGCREKLQIPPLRFAPVGMTKETVALPLASVADYGNRNGGWWS
jgi:hypothetical protein